MKSVAQQILEGVRDALKAHPSLAGVQVFLDRDDRLGRSEMPTILIAEASEGENVDPQTVSGGMQRVYSVQISCVVAHKATHAADARELGAKVEVVMGVPSFPVPKPGRARLAATRLTSDSEGEVPMASQEQIWRFTYSTRRGAPDVAL